MEQDVHAPTLDARGAGVPRGEPVRPARPRLRLRLERNVGRAGHHRRVRRGNLCEPNGGQPTKASKVLRVPWPVPAHGRAQPHETRGRRTWPTARHRAARRSRRSGTRMGLVIARRDDRRASRSPTRSCARPTTTRSTRRAASPTSTTRTRSAARRTSSTPPPRSATRSTGSTPTTSTSPTSTPENNPERQARPRPDPPGGARSSNGRATTRTSTRRPTRPFAQHPQVIDQDYLTSWNNKQAPGYAAPEHGRHVYVDLPLTVARRPDQGGDQAQGEDRARRTWSTRWRTPGRWTLRGTKVLPLPAQGDREDQRPHARGCAQPAARLGADGARTDAISTATAATTTRRRSRSWTRGGRCSRAPCTNRCSGPTSTSSSPAWTRSTTRPTTTAITSARPGTSAGTAACRRTSSTCWRTRRRSRSPRPKRKARRSTATATAAKSKTKHKTKKKPKKKAAPKPRVVLRRREPRPLPGGAARLAARGTGRPAQPALSRHRHRRLQ